MPQQITNAAVKPVLECVVNNGGGSYTAWFGYQNLNTIRHHHPCGNKQQIHSQSHRSRANDNIPARKTAIGLQCEFQWKQPGLVSERSRQRRKASTASSNSSPCATQPPVANAGQNQTVYVGSTVQLDGTGSTDPQGYALTYQWSFVSVPNGSTATLNTPTSSTPTFVADKAGTYTAQLIVNDGHSSSSPAQVVISTQYAPPTANAGANKSVTNGATVQLDGGHSTDPSGLPLTYQWTFTSIPTGSAAVLSSTTGVNPTFVVDKVGNYVVQLIVNNGYSNSSPSQVTVSDVYTPPTANAGPIKLSRWKALSNSMVVDPLIYKDTR